ncbi:hypothetical protein JCM3765_002488 [Sporobolomyces pararoseus]
MELSPSQIEPQSQSREQDLLNHLVESISSSLPISQVEELLLQLDSEQLNQLHSITRLSPLEALLSRYPNLEENDLTILNLLFKKGADLGRVSEEVQERMIVLQTEGEEGEKSSVVSQFEARLVKRYEEMDEIQHKKQGVGIEEEAQIQSRSSSLAPLTASSSSSSSVLKAPERQRRSSTPPPPPSQSLIDSTISVQAQGTPPFNSSPSHPWHRPRSSQSNPSETHPRQLPSTVQFPQLLSPRNPSLSRSPPPSHARSIIPPRLFPPSDPKDLVRLYIPLPLGTREHYLIRYFHFAFHIEITNLSLFTSRSPSFGFFDVSREIWERKELLSEERIWEIERINPLKDLDGRAWGIRLRVAREVRTEEEKRGVLWRDRGGNESRRWRSETEEREVRASKNSTFDRSDIQRGRRGQSDSTVGRHSSEEDEDGWITLILSGFPQDTTHCDVQDLLSEWLRYWEDLSLSYDGGIVEARFKVRGYKAAEDVVREVKRFTFEGRRLEVQREKSVRLEYTRSSRHTRSIEGKREGSRTYERRRLSSLSSNYTSRSRSRSPSQGYSSLSNQRYYSSHDRMQEEEEEHGSFSRRIHRTHRRRSLSPSPSRRSRHYDSAYSPSSSDLDRSPTPSHVNPASSFVSRIRDRSAFEYQHLPPPFYRPTPSRSTRSEHYSSSSSRPLTRPHFQREPRHVFKPIATRPWKAQTHYSQTQSFHDMPHSDSEEPGGNLQAAIRGDKWRREGWKQV